MKTFCCYHGDKRWLGTVAVRKLRIWQRSREGPENAFQMWNPAPQNTVPRVSSDKEVNRDGKPTPAASFGRVAEHENVRASVCVHLRVCRCARARACLLRVCLRACVQAAAS